MADLEDDWEVLRRDPRERQLPTTSNMAEALERVCIAMQHYAILLHDDEEKKMRERVIRENLVPQITFIPVPQWKEKKAKWRCILQFELVSSNYKSTDHDSVEDALAEVFNAILRGIDVKAEEFTKEANNLEHDVKVNRDTARRLSLIRHTMGEFSVDQLNLPMDLPPELNLEDEDLSENPY